MGGWKGGEVPFDLAEGERSAFSGRCSGEALVLRGAGMSARGGVVCGVGLITCNPVFDLINVTAPLVRLDGTGVDGGVW